MLLTITVKKKFQWSSKLKNAECTKVKQSELLRTFNTVMDTMQSCANNKVCFICEIYLIMKFLKPV